MLLMINRIFNICIFAILLTEGTQIEKYRFIKIEYKYRGGNNNHRVEDINSLALIRMTIRILNHLLDA